MDEADAFDDHLQALEMRLGDAAAMTAAFDGELQAMHRSMVFTGREVDTLSRSIGGGLRRAFDGVAFEGVKLSDALRQVARGMADSVYSVAVRPVQDALGGAVARGLQGAMSALTPFAQGGGFAQGRVMPFAQGGVVTGPVGFAMRGGATGLMGEAGPEAIMPLARGPDGRLGVQATPQGGSGPAQVVINVSTPDVEGFRRSQSQIAAQMGRALARGQRNR